MSHQARIQRKSPLPADYQFGRGQACEVLHSRATEATPAVARIVDEGYMTLAEAEAIAWHIGSEGSSRGLTVIWCPECLRRTEGAYRVERDDFIGRWCGHVIEPADALQIAKAGASKPATRGERA